MPASKKANSRVCPSSPKPPKARSRCKATTAKSPSATSRFGRFRSRTPLIIRRAQVPRFALALIADAGVNLQRMMIRRYTLEHFRAFVSPVEIELRPLTLFFGYNNSGKSALLRGLVALLKSLRGDVGYPWVRDSELTRGVA